MTAKITDGTDSRDVFYGDSGDDIMHGYGGDDALMGYGGNNQLFGGDGNDFMVSYEGNDLMDGGAGNDTLESHGGNDTFVGGAGNDSISLYGSVYTDGEWQKVDAGDGDDRIELFGARFQESADLTGGAGIDTLKITSALFHNFTAMSEASGFEQIDGYVRGNVFGTDDDDHIDFGGLTVVNGVEGLNIDGGAGNDDLFGTEARDQISGGEGHDYIAGNAGDDVLYGQGGDDYIDGGAGNDIIYGNAGNDEAYGGDGNDTIYADDGHNKSFGGDGNDYLEALSGSNLLSGDAGDDVILSRGDGDLTQGDGDTVLGGDGNDTLRLLGTVTSIDGGAGSDTAHFEGAHVHNIDLAASSIEYYSISNPLLGSTLDDRIDLSGATLVNQFNGSASYVDIRGGAGNDTIITGSSDDHLYGEDGNDVLEGGAGNDTIDGGGAWNAPGMDVATYEHAASAVHVDLHLLNQVQDTGGAGKDYLTGIEGLRGSAFNDVLTGSDSTYGELLQGGAGNDTLRGGLGGDTIEGGAGDDVIYGGGRYTDVSGIPPYINKPLVPEHLTQEVLKGGAGADTYVFNGFDDFGEWINFQTWQIVPGPGQTGSVATNFVEDVYGGDTPTLVEFNAGEGDRLDFSNMTWTGRNVPGFINAGLSYSIVGDHTEVYYSQGYLTSTVPGSPVGYAIAHIVLSSKVDLKQVTQNGHTYYVGIDISEGTSGDDHLVAIPAGGSFYGHEGNDTMDSGAGNDWFDGGDGSDTVSYASATGTVRVDLNKTVDQVTGAGGTDRLTNIENLDGSNYNDVLTGNGSDNVLHGSGGNDNLIGNAGNDYLDGGADNDTLNGGTGDDTLVGGTGNDKYYVDSIRDVVLENPGAGTDTVYASVDYGLSANVEDLILTDSAVAGNGNDGNNHIYGTAGHNVLDGGAGNDSLFGNEGDDALHGGVGNDWLDGGSGADTMFGGVGADTYIVDNAGDVVDEHGDRSGDDGAIDTVMASVGYALGYNVENLVLTGSAAIDGAGNELNNVLTGNGASNHLYGGEGNDTLNGGAGDDSLFGGNGKDSLDGGTGADHLYGGAGADIYVVDNAGDIVDESQGVDDGAIDKVMATVNYALTDHVEVLTLTGTADLQGTGNELANTITGNTGNNLLDGAGGNDTLIGGAGTDTLIGGEGNDSLDGGAGADKMYGGHGADTYVVNDIHDVVDETLAVGGVDDGAIDTVNASVDFTLSDLVEVLNLTGTAITGTGNGLDNTLTGNNAANVLYGLGGNDNLDGHAGADTMFGGAGDDTYTVDNMGDVASEESKGAGIDDGGNDRVLASVSYTLGNYIESLTLTGSGVISGTGNDLANNLYGNSAANRLSGMDGNDKIKGGGGDDTIIGGAGNDWLEGDDGSDKFLFSAASVNGTDKIQDFVHGSDWLLFKVADYGFSSGHTLTASEFTVGDHAVGNHAQFVWDSGAHTLYWDHDGAGGDAAVALATFVNGANIDASDLHFT